MFRFVFLASLGVLTLQPAFAQDEALAQLSPSSGPGSSIARSSFAQAQRDEARESSPVSRPLLQVAQPPSPSVFPRSAAPVRPTNSEVAPSASTKAGIQLRSVPVALAPVNVPAVASPTPASLTPPLTTQPLTAKATETNQNATNTVAKPVFNASQLSARPKVLASREAMRQRMLLARLDADLAITDRRLNRAQSRLSESQRQLGAFTNVIRSAMMEAGDEGSGLHPFVRVAQRYIGTPYVWGGESARGFDCSGFIMRVMRDLGYRALPHSAAEQFHYGLPVARELLKPGDIVFFANTYKPGVSHVGIYLGRGRFIHAANSKVGTIISSINEPKWVAHYAGARRLVKARA